MPESLDTNFDNTKIKDYLRCPRYYYFRHVRHWRSQGWAAPLVFGLGIHKAMEYMNIKAKDLMDNHGAESKDWDDFIKGEQGESFVSGAIINFLSVWDEDPPPPDYPLKARNPDKAAAIIQEYPLRYNLFQHKIISIEKPFLISLEDADYCGRKDREVIREGLGVVVDDYKTTYTLSRFGEKFMPDRQMMGYTLAGKIQHETSSSPEKFWGAYVTGILVQMSKVDFLDVPLKLNNNALEFWVWETLYYINQINTELEILYELRESGKVKQLNFLPCFPTDDNRCWDWNRQCQYNRECLVGNPERLADSPGGFVKDKWDPKKVNGVLGEDND